MIKFSKKLDKIISDIIFLQKMDYDIDFIQEINPNCFAIENENKCRSDHFDKHIRDGAALATKSIKASKPIYCSYHNDSDIFFYFVEDLDNLLKRLKAKLKNLNENSTRLS